MQIFKTRKQLLHEIDILRKALDAERSCSAVYEDELKKAYATINVVCDALGKAKWPPKDEGGKA